jgi:hypothetical protein
MMPALPFSPEGLIFKDYSGIRCSIAQTWTLPVDPKFRFSIIVPLTRLADWIRIATEIEHNYSFDAFVILHGTDTMAYTASALSFLLEDLGKTVVCRLRSVSVLYANNSSLDIDWCSNSAFSIAK